jgi:hypothetical protein
MAAWLLLPDHSGSDERRKHEQGRIATAGSLPALRAKPGNRLGLRIAQQVRMLKTTRVLSIGIWCSLMVPAVLLASGCTMLGLNCTEVGCLYGATIAIRGLEANQSYEVNVETTNETIKCTIDTRQDMDGFVQMSCGDDVPSYFSQVDSAQISLDDTPDRVAITVRQNGAVVAQDDVTPVYQRSAPNGEACGPVCHHAEIPVEL